MDSNQPMPPSSPMQSGTVRSVTSAPVSSSPQSVSTISPTQTIQPSPSTPNTSNTSGMVVQQNQQPHHPGNSNDLYAQITAEDEEVIVETKKKTVPLISILAVFMKFTFWVDEMRRAHERFFIFLQTIWAGIMGVIYLSGSITLFLSVFSFMQLPIYLEKYFSERGLQYDSLEMADYSFSKVNVINLRDKNDTYKIPEITVHSTFADFLQNRIRMVEASNLNINISADSNEHTSDFDLIIKLLQAFSEPKKTGLELDINTIRINNAILNIKTKNRIIPVSFSLSGTYTGNNELVVPFSINEDFLKMDAKVTITGPENNRKVEIKINDKTGYLTLPQRPTEQLEGSVSIEMENHKIQTITLDTRLNYANSLKTIRANLKSDSQDMYNGSLLFTIGDSSDGIHTSSLSTDVTFSFQELNFKTGGQITTDKPLQVSLRRLSHKNTTFEGVNTTLKGKLSCLIDKASCTYSLSEKSLLQMGSMQFDVKGHVVRFSQNPILTILPAKSDNIKLQLASPYFQMDAPFENIKLTGNVGEKSEELLFDAATINLQMTLAQKTADTHFRILIQNANYLTNDLSMGRINMLIDDYFDETSKIQFSAYSVQTGLDILKKPISLDVTTVGEQTAIQARLMDTNVSLNAQGYFNPFKFSFSGRFAIPLLDLDNLPFSLSEISSAFPKNISDLKGQFTASGQLKINGISSILGPFFVGLKDVSFNWDKTTIAGINGVLGLQSLEPLVTANNQKLFIQDVQSFLPISNLLIQFYINNKSFRLSNATGQIAGQDVIMTSALIPLKNTNVSVPLRTPESFNLSKLDPYFNLPGITLIQGDCSFSLPIEITESGINLGDLTIKIFDGIWRKNDEQLSLLKLFHTNDLTYTVRSGQLVFNSHQQLEVALDGWRMPSKEKDSFGPEKIQLSTPLLKTSPLKIIPSDIQGLQNKLGM